MMAGRRAVSGEAKIWNTKPIEMKVSPIPASAASKATLDL